MLPLDKKKNTIWTLYNVTVPSQLAAVNITLNTYILISNVLVIMTLKRMGKLTIQHYYILGLVGSDLIVFVINTAAAVIEIKREVRTSQALCAVLGISSAAACITTALIHTAMSVDRWVSVQFPFKYRTFQSGEKSRLITVTIIVSCFVLPYVYMILLHIFGYLGVYFDPSIPFCTVTSGKRGLFALLSCTAIFFILPSTIQAFTNIHMLIKVTKLQGATRTRTIKSVKTVITTLGVFYLCWFPIGIWLLWDMSISSHPNGVFAYFAIRMLVCNSGMSFPIYIRTLPGFKEKFMSMIRRCNAQVHSV